MDKSAADARSVLAIFFIGGLLPMAANPIQRQISGKTPQPFAVVVFQDGRSGVDGVSFVQAVRDGVGLAKTALDVAKWPLDQATSLLNSHLTVTSTLIALFNLAVDLLVRPGGSGDLLLAWLTANSTSGVQGGRQASASSGASLASDLLSAARWPLDVGLNLLGSALAVSSSLLALFNLLVDLTVRPGGTGAILLSWLRGADSTT